MFFSSTSIAYFLLSLALGFLTYRFFQYWIQNRTTTSKLFLFLALSFFLFALVRVISVLFFAYNLKVLNGSIVAVSFIEGLAASVVAYLIIHLKFPKISPWIGFIVIFLLGIWATILTAGTDYQPLVEENGAIDWGFSASEVGMLYLVIRFGIILITFVPIIIILLQQFLYSGEPIIRKRSLGLSVVLLLGIGLGFIDFVLNNFLKIGVATYRDYTTIIISFFILLVTFLTQKPEESKQQNL
jgi:hypothetical protein